MTDATGRVGSVVVLGGGSAIGLAIARGLVARGARAVILGARRPETLADALAALRAAGAQAAAIPFDAEAYDAHEAAVAEAFERARALGGDVDVAILAAARIDASPVLEESPAEAGRVVAVTLAGATSAGLAVAQAMRRQGHGTLIVLSSLAGQRPRPSILPYAAAKRGLDAFADGLGEALAGSGVRVMTVRPGWVRTPMTVGRRDAPFATTPERVARDVLRGLDRGDRVVWTPGAVRWVACVLRLLPRPLFRLLARSR